MLPFGLPKRRLLSPPHILYERHLLLLLPLEFLHERSLVDFPAIPLDTAGRAGTLRGRRSLIPAGTPRRRRGARRGRRPIEPAERYPRRRGGGRDAPLGGRSGTSPGAGLAAAAARRRNLRRAVLVLGGALLGLVVALVPPADPLDVAVVPSGTRGRGLLVVTDISSLGIATFSLHILSALDAVLQSVVVPAADLNRRAAVRGCAGGPPETVHERLPRDRVVLPHRRGGLAIVRRRRGGRVAVVPRLVPALGRTRPGRGRSVDPSRLDCGRRSGLRGCHLAGLPWLGRGRRPGLRWRRLSPSGSGGSLLLRRALGPRPTRGLLGRHPSPPGLTRSLLALLLEAHPPPAFSFFRRLLPPGLPPLEVHEAVGLHLLEPREARPLGRLDVVRDRSVRCRARRRGGGERRAVRGRGGVRIGGRSVSRCGGGRLRPAHSAGSRRLQAVQRRRLLPRALP